MKTMGRVGLCTVEATSAASSSNRTSSTPPTTTWPRWFPNLRSPGGRRRARADRRGRRRRPRRCNHHTVRGGPRPVARPVQERGDGAGHLRVAAVRHWEALTDEAPLTPPPPTSHLSPTRPVPTRRCRCSPSPNWPTPSGSARRRVYDDSSFAPLTPEQIDAFTITGVPGARRGSERRARRTAPVPSATSWPPSPPQHPCH